MNQPQTSLMTQLRQPDGAPSSARRWTDDEPDDPAYAPEAATPRVDDDWRRWIAENLMLNGSRESILNAMTARGISPEEAAREYDLAAQSPYVRGAEILRSRLHKREWLLETYRVLSRMDPASGEVPRRHKLSRDEFRDQFYSTNRPVIITGMMDDWPAMQKWNLDYFASKFGDREIEVQVGRNAGENYEVEREKFLRTVTMARFIEMIRQGGATNDFYLTANNNNSNKKVLPELWDDIVQVPEYLDDTSRLGGFFWLGPAGTVTPFHHDLTNNFMAQVIGRKRVKLVPSWDVALMKNDFHCYSKVDGRITPPAPHPAPNEPQVLECILDRGEILFLPIAGFHYVEAMDISVTVSFTNFVFDNEFAHTYTTYHKL